MSAKVQTLTSTAYTCYRHFVPSTYIDTWEVENNDRLLWKRCAIV